MGTWWQQVIEASRADFSDLPDAGDATRIILRLLLAALLGGALGFEREHAGKAAGLRTHMLVALGAALFILVPQQSGVKPADLTRVLQGLIAGIGFLGAGSIIKKSDGDEVHGLTTAASIWLTAAIGTAVGMGRAASALLSTVLALLILTGFPRIAARISAGLFPRRPGRPAETGNRD